MDISKMKVLSIDDNRNNLLMIEAYSKRLNLQVKSFAEPQQALEFSKIHSCDIVIVDYMMPQMNGIKFIKEFRKIYEDIPIIMITAAGDNGNLQLEALEVGATDFMSKPVNGAIFQVRVQNLLKLKKSLILVENKADLLEEEIIQATKNVHGREMEALQKLGKLAEFKDPETSSHVKRVAHYSRIISKYYGLSEEVQKIIFYAAPLHDIGKVGVPDSILLKPGKLNREEWEKMKTHTELGHEILKGAKSIFLKAGSIISITHHERYDGKGYPKGLSGERIPIFGRIVALADVFDALCTKRPYKEAWSFEEAVDYIIKENGEHFDPKCVACFLNHIDEVKEIYHKYRD